MRLFGYYACHSFVNQIKKLFRSWVLIFMAVCVLGGFGVGQIAGSTADKAEENRIEQEAKNPEKEKKEKPTDSFGQILKSSGLKGEEFLYLFTAVGVIILILFFIGTADKGGSIFLPADVTLLFSSPLKPQSVLMFRLFTRMGTFVFLTLYVVFMNVQMTEYMGVGAFVSVMLVIAWILAFTTAKLLQTYFYLECEKYPVLKKNLRYMVIAVAAILILASYAYSKDGDISAIQAAERILNARGTNQIPVYGWLKGIVIAGMTGHYAASVIYAALSTAVAAGIVFLIYHQKADFYESAIEKTADNARTIEKASNSRVGVATGKERKRSDTSRENEGIGHGWGASVFFFKAMHNRFRQSGHGILTKTSVTYIALSVLGGLFANAQWNVNGALASILILMMLVFWRSLGNPLAEDTRMGFFLMIPESPWKKLFFSLISGTVNCILDLLPSVIIVALLFRPSVGFLLASFCFLLTTDMYATLVSVFLDSSVPKSVDKVVRQLVQVIFIYFGMIPDILLLVMEGYMHDRMLEEIPYCALLNLTISVVLFGITPLVMEDMKVRPAKPSTDSFTGDLKLIRSKISQIGFGMALIIVLSAVSQLIVAFLVKKFFPGVQDNPIGFWLVAMLPEYLIGFPVGLFIIRKVTPEPPPDKKLGGRNFLKAIPSGIFAVMLGSIVGQLILWLFSQLSSNVQTTSGAQSMATVGPLWIRILFLVVLAPMIEEFTFRKTLIDRLRPYGETTAIFFSAIAFGLFHGNFSQMFYAFGMGLVFGTIYEKTGRLRYSLILHMATNFIGGIIVPSMLAGVTNTSELTLSNLPVGLIVYVCAYYGLALVGFVVFTISCVKTRFYTQRLELPGGKVVSTVYGNLGMIVFFIACAAIVVMQTYLMKAST